MATRETAQGTTGPQVTAAVAEAERVDPAAGTRFTDAGPLPPVASAASGGGPPPTPSASERADAATVASKPAPKTVAAIPDADTARAQLRNPTWDPNATYTVAKPDGSLDTKKGGWVDATAAANAVGAVTTIDDKDVDKRMVQGTTIDPAQIHGKLAAGTLSEAELNHLTPAQAAQVNPLGPTPRALLKHALHESWHEAKHTLLAPGGNEEARKILMAKLWEYRQWHHAAILKQTQADPTITDVGLSGWAAAGSTTLTSDIDVNLKGTRTEQAVAVFNRKFREDGWKHEAGVVYDVNVYALDFMHGGTFAGLKATPGADGAAETIARHKFAKGDTSTRVSANEGEREGTAGGGVSAGSAMLAERMQTADADLQRVWSLVKMRLYMTGAQWQAHVDATQLPPSTVAAIDLRYQSYMTDLMAKMADGAKLAVKVDAMKQTGFAVLDAVAQAKGKAAGQDGENVKMAASNRLYEARLTEMATMRTHVQAQIARRAELLKGKDGAPATPEMIADAEGLDAAIDGNLAILRDLISECAMFSNEAYVTDGAVNHVVVGLQQKIGITQTKGESMDAFNENVADSLKEIARHGSTLGEAAYKAGKYLWRMADAAQNLGDRSTGIANLYATGYRLANEIKGGSKTQAQLETEAGNAVISGLGIASPEGLMTLVRYLAAGVTMTHATDVSAHGLERARPVQATKA